jgi:hypothetical protein
VERPHDMVDGYELVLEVHPYTRTSWFFL